MRRVRAADPESAALADVAIAALTVLELVWRVEEGCPLVAQHWHRVRMAVEVAPVADLQTALDAALGLRDVARRFPYLADDLGEIADKVHQRAWERERRRLGIKPRPRSSSLGSCPTV